MKQILQISLAALIFLSLLDLHVSIVRCNDGTYCGDGMKCCPTLIHTYRCCEIISECSKDGNFCIYSSTSFLFENNAQSSVESNKHQEVLKANVQDYLVIADSFLETIGFYNNFPQTTSCGKNLSVLIPDIIELVNKIKERKKIEEIIPILISVYTELLPKIKEAINKCPGVIEEIAVNVKEMIGIVTTKGYIKEIIENAKKRFPEILININSAVMMFRDGYFKQCGRNAGLALAILLKID